MAMRLGSNQTNDDGSLKLGGKRRGDDEMDITPMIDIVFLLLIFFVVCSKLDPSKSGAHPEAERGLAVKSNDSALIIMERGSEDRAKVMKFDGSPFPDDDELQRNEIVDYVAAQLESGKQEVLIAGHRNTPVGEVARIQRIIGDGFDNLKATYIAVKEK